LNDCRGNLDGLGPLLHETKDFIHVVVQTIEGRRQALYEEVAREISPVPSDWPPSLALYFLTFYFNFVRIELEYS
jgi:hypothetical protein